MPKDRFLTKCTQDKLLDRGHHYVNETYAPVGPTYSVKRISKLKKRILNYDTYASYMRMIKKNFYKLKKSEKRIIQSHIKDLSKWKQRFKEIEDIAIRVINL